MAKEYDFNWQPCVSKALRQGAYLDRWDEDLGLIESHCFVCVDEFGFYLQWMSDGKDAQLIDLVQVSETRRGGLPKEPKFLFDLEQRLGRESLEERSLTVVSGLDYVTLTNTHFVAQDVPTALAWHECLQKVLHNCRVYHVCPRTCLLKHWKMLSLSVNERRKIPVRSITRTFASGKTERMVMQCLVELGLCLGKNDEIEPVDFTFEKFYELYLKICPRTDVQELFLQLSSGSDGAAVDTLITFLNDKQRDPRLNEILFPHYDRNRVLQLIAKYDKHEECLAKEKLCLDGFLRYLMSDENAPVFLDRVEVYQQMDQPLCHYFINSSHNTYLIGRQFGGRSSVDIYRQVLLTGCRCIELDCWDGTGDDRGEPIITHGKAMCTDVLFRDVIVAIRDTAFTVSEFPVILSFENHCSKANQLKMARYCIDILGDLLLTRPLDSHALEPGVPLPSPILLKRKILIKNKRLKPDEERRQLEQFLKEGRIEEDVEECENPEISACDEVMRSTMVEEGSEQLISPVLPAISETRSAILQAQSATTPASGCLERERSFSLESAAVSTRTVSNRPSREISAVPVLVSDEAHPELKAPEASSFKSKLKSLTKMNAKETDLSTEEELRLLEMYHYTGATTKIHPLLSSIINYTHPVRFQAFDLSEQTNCHFHMSSFSESTGLGLLKTSALEFVNYNKRQFSRIYPKGGRVDSSNFLPQIFWNAGVQLVALNFQTPDLAMQLNQGRFEYNGGCGYLLKPDFMRRPDRMFDPFSESPVDGVIAAFCSIRVISGQFLSDKKIGTYVEVEMYGLPTDTIRKEFRTRIVPANGLNPVYNEEPFVFRKVVLPELAVFRIAVYDENNKLLGQRILPLDGLQAGFRHISLRTETSLPMTLPTVFCHIVLKTYVPKGLAELVDALADPRAHLMEKRQKQMEHMGINKDEIEDVPVQQRRLANANISAHAGPGQQHNMLSATTSVRVAASAVTDKDKLNSSSSSPSQLHNLAAGSASISAPHSPIEPVRVEDLKKDKLYVKLLKKHKKEMDEFDRLHSKRQTQLEKQQCSAIEKILSDHNKNSKRSGAQSANKISVSSKTAMSQPMTKTTTPSSGEGTPSAERQLSTGSATLSAPVDHSYLQHANSYTAGVPVGGAGRHGSVPSAAPKDLLLLGVAATTTHAEAVQSCVWQQTQDWSQLVRRQVEQRYALRRQHQHDQWDLLKKLQDEAHHRQLAVLKQRFETENKALKLQQTKKSMDDSKAIHADKSIKTKGERERRVKELQEQNLKIFVEERKRLVVKHQKPEDQLRKCQVEEKEALEKEMKKALESDEQAYKEALLAVKPETLV